MKTKKKNNPRIKAIPKKLFRVSLLIGTSLCAFAALIIPLATRPMTYALQVGEVAPQDIQAPYAYTYESEVRTAAERKQASAAVPDVYETNYAIAKQQRYLLTASLYSISNIRNEADLTHDEKVSGIVSLQDNWIDSANASVIADVGPFSWQTIQSETLRVLDEVMGSPITEYQILDARDNLPIRSGTLTSEEVSLISLIVKPFIVPNRFYNAEKTAQNREQAASSVDPVKVSFLAREIIVRQGQVITPEIQESLKQFGLIQSEQKWQDIVSSFGITGLLILLTILYFHYRKAELSNNIRGLALIAAAFLLFLFSAKIFIPNRAIIPYIFPLPAFGLLVASMFSMEVGFIFSIFLSILVGINLQNGFEITLFYILSSFCGILVLGKGRRIAHYFWAGIMTAIAGFFVIMAFRLPNPLSDWIGLATLAGASIICGLASASITLIIQFVLSHLFGIVTPLRLVDLARPDHSLLKLLLQNAPGTYQHSLMVANLGEQAAEAINADGMLVRVGALYHDVGKTSNPGFFIENQIPGKPNPHEKLPPEKSASIILNHIPEGLRIAKKHRLPPRLRDFIAEHHGTLITFFQYSRALILHDEDPQKVDKEKFRYEGPAPRSKETALVMMADNVEARARADLPKNEEEIAELVGKTIEFCQKEGQLNSTNITIHNLQQIKESFTKTLVNIYHPRIPYPEIEQEQKLETSKE